MNNDIKLLAEQYEYIQDLALLENIEKEKADVQIAFKIKALLPEFKKAKESGDQANYDRIKGEIVDLLAQEFAPEAKEAVQMFEGDKIKTTRGNYGKYGSFLSQFQGLYKLGIVKALRNAGAGQGLEDALRVF
jgi:hypothetical protein